MIPPNYKALEAPLRDRIIDTYIISSKIKDPGFFESLKKTIMDNPAESTALAGLTAGLAGTGGLVASKWEKPLPDKIQDAISDKYDDAASWASDNPELATALGVGIPGALLAGAGALALRRRQRNAK